MIANRNRTLTFMAAAAIAAAGVMAWTPSSARAATNLLANPGFENGAGGGSLAGWTPFGNAFTEGTNTGAATHAGDGVAKMFGNFSGGFNVTGAFQSFPTTPGTSYQLHVFSRHNANDALTGGTADNFVVEKIAFFDAGGNEIASAAVEARILDAVSPLDTWIDNPTITGTAPAGAASVNAFILFLQPQFAGGAGFFDDASFTLVPEPASLGLLGTAGAALLGRRRRCRVR